MDSTIIQTVQDTANCLIQSTRTSCADSGLDVFYKMSMVIIAIINVLFAIWLYIKNSNSDREKNIYESRRSMLSILILNHKMNAFYDCMKSIQSSTYSFVRENNTNTELKNKIESKVSDEFINLRLHFIDIFAAVDFELSEKLQNEADNLQAIISKAIWDSGINLNVKEKYDEQIMNPISTTQTTIIKLIYNFK